MMLDPARFTRNFHSEAPGRDRAEAIANLLARFDQHPGSNRLPASRRVRVLRVRRLGPGWWSITWTKPRPNRRHA
jgi:hypothetical protein